MFGQPVGDYQLTQVKLARMAVIIQASRQFAYQVARLMAKGEGAMEASMVKAYVCRAAEWVTREAMQIHGGMGYAEEFPVSRYFVDARVLSIFEGADETLALKVIARRLVEGGQTVGRTTQKVAPATPGRRPISHGVRARWIGVGRSSSRSRRFVLISPGGETLHRAPSPTWPQTLVAAGAAVACMLAGHHAAGPHPAQLAADRCVGRVVGRRSGHLDGVRARRAARPRSPRPSDAGYLLAVPLMVVGLLTLPATPRAERTRRLADGLVVGGSVLAVAWVLVMGHVLAMQGAPLDDGARPRLPRRRHRPHRRRHLAHRAVRAARGAARWCSSAPGSALHHRWPTAPSPT